MKLPDVPNIEMFYKTNLCTSDFRRLYVVPSLIAYNECSAQPVNTEEEL